MRKDPRSTVGYNLKSKPDDLSHNIFLKESRQVTCHLIGPTEDKEKPGGGRQGHLSCPQQGRGAGGGGLAVPASIRASFLRPQQKKGSRDSGAAVWVP